MSEQNVKFKVKHKSELDQYFRPIALENREFQRSVIQSGNSVELAIAIERGSGMISVFNTMVYRDGSGKDEENNSYVERLVKSLIWIRGGWRIVIGGSSQIGEFIKKAYSEGGIREFDARFMARVYEKKFVVEITDINQVPGSKEESNPIGRHLKGCRIGFDAGGSDRKVCAVIDGNVVYSEEVIWHPKTESNPDYHYTEIMKAMKTAASYMPKVDAIGVSSAGVYVDNRIMVASLFLKVSEELFNKKVKNMFLSLQQEMGSVPLQVANDGDVTALAGAMELEDTNVLGIAMGTSEAGGYVDGKGNITGWLNELAFVPVDLNQDAMKDEWSGDYGCGVKYFSQDALIKLSPAAGIVFPELTSPAEKLKFVQELHAKGDKRAEKIFETIGIYLGYALGHYADFYDLKHVLVLGRVTSAEGGDLIINKAKTVLIDEFPEIWEKIKLHLPDESNRRVGQSIAAASLPELI